MDEAERLKEDVSVKSKGSEKSKSKCSEADHAKDEKSEKSVASSVDYMTLFSKMPRHVFSDPDVCCECSDTSSKCKCITYDRTERPGPEVQEVCECLLPDSKSSVEITKRKKRVLNVVSRTEEYLTKRRIPQLLRWLATKVTAETPRRPVLYLERLINELMLFRAGISKPPVLYEERHLKAVIKSFDPGDRGWLSAGQVKRLYYSLGLEIDPPKDLEEQVPTDALLTRLKKDQCEELRALVTAGIEKPVTVVPSNESSVFQAFTNFDSDITAGNMSDQFVKDVYIESKAEKERRKQERQEKERIKQKELEYGKKKERKYYKGLM